MTDNAHIRTERHGEIAVVVFDRPEKRNAFNLAMWQSLAATMRTLSDDGSLRAVVLRGAGAEAFSAGADISAFEIERGTREKVSSGPRSGSCTWPPCVWPATMRSASIGASAKSG